MAKKIFTILGGVAVLCALSGGALLHFGAILSVAVCIALAIVAQKLHKYLPPKSVLIAEAITLLIGIGGLAYVDYLDSTGYWANEWFGGLGESLLALSTVVVGFLTLITSAICQHVARGREKKESALDISDET